MADKWDLRWVLIVKRCGHKSGELCTMFMCYDDIFECTPDNCPKIRFEKNTEKEYNGDVELDTSGSTIDIL